MTAKKKKTPDEVALKELYHLMLDFWNARDASAIASLYEKNGNVVGFDGSQINGVKEIKSEMSRIFKNHKTDPYIGKVKSVRFLKDNVALIRAIAGMVPRGQKGKKPDINPKVNTVHSLVAVKKNGDWYISLFQNTPAQFHGRPEVSAAFSKEIRELLRS